jgi:hypothetical protein
VLAARTCFAGNLHAFSFSFTALARTLTWVCGSRGVTAYEIQNADMTDRGRV